MANFAHITLGKTAAAVAIVSMISAVSLAYVSGAQSTGMTQKNELRDVLCRIDRRCPNADVVARTHSASTAFADLTQKSDLRGLLCRIDRRCPNAEVIARQSSRVHTAEMTVR
jgi:hypothetical protein